MPKASVTGRPTVAGIEISHADRRIYPRPRHHEDSARALLRNRLMKYWIMQMADPSPFGETSFRAIVRAICDADPANVRDGGCVESILTVLTRRRFGTLFRHDADSGYRIRQNAR